MIKNLYSSEKNTINETMKIIRDMSFNELLKHNKGRTFRLMTLNPNDIVVDFIMEKIHLFKNSRYFIRNVNKRIIKYIIKNIEHYKVKGWLSANESDEVVNFLLENPKYINYNSATINSHPKMVDHCFANLDKWKHKFTSMENANLNLHPRMIDFVLGHPERIDWFVIFESKNIFELDLGWFAKLEKLN